MTRVIVTGANGFIGREFVLELQAAGYEVVALGRDALRLPLRPLPRASILFHLAGRAHVLDEAAADPEMAFRQANVTLTLALARASLETSIDRFVFVSSAGVLGATSPAAGLDDDSPPLPYDAYTRSKYLAEQELQDMTRDGLELVIVRPPLVYGPGARGNLARIEHAVRSGWPLPVGGLRALRSVVGLRNLCNALEVLGRDPAAAGGSFLVADCEAVDIATLVRDMAHALGLPSRQINVPAPLLAAGLRLAGRRADVARLTRPFVVHPRSLSERLGWQPPFTRAQELCWTFAAGRGSAP